MRLQTVTSVGKAPRPKRHNDAATPLIRVGLDVGDMPVVCV